MCCAAEWEVCRTSGCPEPKVYTLMYLCIAVCLAVSLCQLLLYMYIPDVSRTGQLQQMRGTQSSTNKTLDTAELFL